jgi:type I restriction enzyme S subunit
LGDVCELINGYAFKSSEYNNNADINILTIKNIDDIVNIIDCNKIQSNLKYNKYLVSKNDILMSLTGNIKIGIYKENIKSYLNQRVIKFEKYKNIEPRFLYYYIKFNLIEKIQHNTKGSIQGNISSEEIKDLLIPIPPLSSQEQIVEALDLIYDTIEGNSKLIQNYEKIKKGIIWSSTFNVEKKKMSDVVEINKNNLTKNYKYKTIKYIDISSVNKGCINIDTIKEFNIGEEPCRAKRIISLNDILLSTVRPNLENYLFIDNNIYSENLIGSTGFAVITSTKINSKYLYNYITLPEITNYLVNNAIGSMYPSIDNNTINNIKIPIPTKEIQEYIVTECDYYDNLIDTLKKENERLQNNKIIETVLKSVSNDNQLEESKEKESDEELTKVVEEDKPIKLTKESKSKLKN